MEKSLREINNERIISMIKNKFRPLKQQKQDIILPYLKPAPPVVNQQLNIELQVSKKKKVKEPNISLPEPYHIKEDYLHPLAKKANQYIQQIRKKEQQRNSIQNYSIDVAKSKETQKNCEINQEESARENRVRQSHSIQISALQKYMELLEHSQINKKKENFLGQSEGYFMTQIASEGRRSIKYRLENNSSYHATLKRNDIENANEELIVLRS